MFSMMMFDPQDAKDATGFFKSDTKALIAKQIQDAKKLDAELDKFPEWKAVGSYMAKVPMPRTPLTKRGLDTLISSQKPILIEIKKVLSATDNPETLPLKIS